MRTLLLPCTVALLVGGVAILLAGGLIAGTVAADTGDHSDVSDDDRPGETAVVDYLGAEYALLEVWNDGDVAGYRLTPADEIPPDADECAILRRADGGEYAYEYDESATEERRAAMAARLDRLSERWNDRRARRMAIR